MDVQKIPLRGQTVGEEVVAAKQRLIELKTAEEIAGTPVRG